MNVPFSVNSFPLGTMNISSNDTGMGFNINSIDFSMDTYDSGQGTQLEQFIATLPLKERKLEYLSVEEIDAIMERLRELKLAMA